MECKAARIKPDRCQVDKVVTLPRNTFEQLKREPLTSFDFIRESLDDLDSGRDKTRHCVFRYQSLEDFNSEMRSLVEKYIRLAMEKHKDGSYVISADEIEGESEYFDQGLFFEMLRERPEIKKIDYYAGEYTVTLDKEVLRDNDRKLYPEEIKEMCARHVLWLLDLEGGERADFSYCTVEEFDFTGADRADFTGAKFIDSDFSSVNACSCDFTNAEFSNTYLFDSCFAGSCIDGTDFGTDEIDRVDLEDCCCDKASWKENNSGTQMKESR